MNKEIKIIGLISSPRSGGSNAILTRAALKEAKAEGALVTEVFLKNYTIKYCKGCLLCMAKGGCVIKDDMNELRKIVSDARGIIFSSPNYGNSFNAIMQTFLERLGLFEFLTSSALGDKYVAGISTAAGSGAEKVARSMVNLAKNGIFKRAYVTGFFGINLNGKDVQEVPHALEQARNLGKKMVRDITAGKKFMFQNFFKRGITNLFIKPNFKKFIRRDRDTNLKAVYANLTSRGLI